MQNRIAIYGLSPTRSVGSLQIGAGPDAATSGAATCYAPSGKRIDLSGVPHNDLTVCGFPLWEQPGSLIVQVAELLRPYEPHPRNAGLLIRRESDGTESVGRFVGRRF